MLAVKEIDYKTVSKKKDVTGRHLRKSQEVHRVGGVFAVINPTSALNPLLLNAYNALTFADLYGL